MCVDPKKRNVKLKKQLAAKQLKKENLSLALQIRKTDNSIKYLQRVSNYNKKKR